ncbi:MAG TPA: hypothetical protein ENN03_04460 [bacterium]|nr:hypothetical protein [bacterium]
MGIKEKLHQLIPEESAGTGRKVLPGLCDRIIPEIFRQDTHGEAFYNEVIVTPDHRHGAWRVEPNAGPIHEFLFDYNADGATLSIFDLIFLDTETTGLAGGTGTVPFLVGLGWFEHDRFVLRQYFLRDFSDEPALLQAVTHHLKMAGAIVTYNGKTFDCPLMSSRYILSRLEDPIRSLPHIDLLHPVRRIWRRRLQDCSLTHVERRLLQFERLHDIPGSMIPGVYFEYLRSGWNQNMRSVFTHNQWDVLSLAALLRRLHAVYCDPLNLTHPLDLYSAGRLMEQRGRCDTARMCYQQAFDRMEEGEGSESVLQDLGFLCKRLGRWEEALDAWIRLIGTGRFRIFPYEELAKYYEHRAGDYVKAREWVEKALKRWERMAELVPGRASLEDRSDLLYRLERIKRRLKGANSGLPAAGGS